MSDLIDRQDAIDAIKEFQHGAAEWRDEQVELSDIWHRADSAIASALEIGLRIKKLPSAQPERKKGKWIDITKSGGYFVYKCSECGDLYLEDYYFCPSCGAMMEDE